MVPGVGAVEEAHQHVLYATVQMSIAQGGGVP